MICIQRSDGDDIQITTVFVCDVCHRPIKPANTGNAVYNNSVAGVGAPSPVLHVHKIGCDDIIVSRMQGVPGSACEELDEHLCDLVAGSGVTIRELLTRLVGKESLNDPVYADLRNQVARLTDWLSQQKFASQPLWSK